MLTIITLECSKSHPHSGFAVYLLKWAEYGQYTELEARQLFELVRFVHGAASRP